MPSPKLTKLLSSAHMNQHPKLQLVITARQRDLHRAKDLLEITPALKIGGEDSEAEAEVRAFRCLFARSLREQFTLEATS